MVLLLLNKMSCIAKTCKRKQSKTKNKMQRNQNRADMTHHLSYCLQSRGRGHGLTNLVVSFSFPNLLLPFSCQYQNIHFDPSLQLRRCLHDIIVKASFAINLMVNWWVKQASTILLYIRYYTLLTQLHRIVDRRYIRNILRIKCRGSSSHIIQSVNMSVRRIIWR